jgi:hypothetical protein
MEKDRGTQHMLFQDHEDILDEISHDSLFLFAFCVLQGVPQEKQKATMVNKFVGVNFVTVQYAVMWG